MDRPARSNRLGRRKVIAAVLWWVVLAGIVVVMMAPVGWMLSTAFKPELQILTTQIRWIPDPPTLEHFQTILSRHAIWRWLLNSVIVATAATLLVLLLDSLAGYALARMEFFGRDAIFAVILSMLFVPIQITVIPLFLIFANLGLVDTYAALILPVGANVTGVFLMRQFFLSIPGELEDAARVDGANDWQIWARVVLPLARPALLAVAIVTFLSAWNAFFWPLIATRSDAARPLAVGIAQFLTLRPGLAQTVQAYGPSMAAATIAALPPVLFFFALQRHFIQGVSLTGLKG